MDKMNDLRINTAKAETSVRRNREGGRGVSHVSGED